MNRREMRKKSGEDWDVRMGWRFVAYGEKGEWLSFQIEPMAIGPDLVYVPNESVWSESAPNWATQRRAEIIGRLKSVPWNRKLTWSDSAKGTISSAKRPDEVIRGSLESTPGGRLLERMRLFEQGGWVPHNFSRKLWHWAARKFAAAARGKVTIFVGEGTIPDSVFHSVELPALRANPNVTLDIRQVSDRDAE